MADECSSDGGRAHGHAIVSPLHFSVFSMNDLALQTLTYPHADVPAGGTMLRVAEGVYWLRMPLPFALNHINLWALEDTDGWCLVDSGFGVDATRALWEKLFAGPMAGHPVTRIIVTHYHPDHVGAAAWLVDRCGAEFWMTEAEFVTAHAVREGLQPFSIRQSQDHFRRHGLDDVRLVAQQTRGNAYRIGVPSLPATYRRLMDGDVLTIGGRQWRVTTVFGHAPEHATLYCPELCLLISGDQVLPKITTNVSVWGNQPDGDPLKLFLDSLSRFDALPADTLVLPSHGHVFVGLHARIEQLRDHHQARLAELLAAMPVPRTAAELLPVLFARPLDDHQLMFAMGEIIAHLNHLAYAGRACRQSSSGTLIRYVANH